MNRAIRLVVAFVAALGLMTAAPNAAQAAPVQSQAVHVVVPHTVQDVAMKADPTWDCAAYNYDSNSAFRRCSDTCSWSGTYHIRVKLSQYVGGGQVDYQTKNGEEMQIGSGNNNGSLVMWNGSQWDLVWMRMVAGYGECTSPIKYP